MLADPTYLGGARRLKVDDRPGEMLLRPLAVGLTVLPRQDTNNQQAYARTTDGPGLSDPQASPSSGISPTATALVVVSLVIVVVVVALIRALQHGRRGDRVASHVIAPSGIHVGASRASFPPSIAATNSSSLQVVHGDRQREDSGIVIGWYQIHSSDGQDPLFQSRYIQSRCVEDVPPRRTAAGARVGTVPPTAAARRPLRGNAVAMISRTKGVHMTLHRIRRGAACTSGQCGRVTTTAGILVANALGLSILAYTYTRVAAQILDVRWDC